jgi:hypothetical protein
VFYWWQKSISLWHLLKLPPHILSPENYEQVEMICLVKIVIYGLMVIAFRVPV